MTKEFKISVEKELDLLNNELEKLEEYKIEYIISNTFALIYIH